VIAKEPARHPDYPPRKFQEAAQRILHAFGMINVCYTSQHGGIGKCRSRDSSSFISLIDDAAGTSAVFQPTGRRDRSSLAEL
jgi:hypothetical protein